MTSSSNEELVCYNVYMPHGKRAAPSPFYVSENAEVKNLMVAIRDDPDFKPYLENEERILLKCDDQPILPPDTRFDRTSAWLRTNAERKRMVPAFRLKRYFPNGPAPEEDEMIDVIAVADTILDSPDVICALPNMRASKVSRASKKGKGKRAVDNTTLMPFSERLSLVEKIRKFPSPSEGVKSEKDMREWVDESSGVHAHLPAGNHGPPTALFHRTLARLKHRLKHLDQVPEPSADHYKWSHQFVITGSDGIKDEIPEEALKSCLHELIGETAKWRMKLDDGKAVLDAVWGERIPRGILELRNLDGVGGNATLQGVFGFAKLLTQETYKKYLLKLNCPVVIIGIMGSRLEISTAIFTDEIYSDKFLSEDFFIDAWQSETVLRVGRIFKALSLAIAELREYYAPFEIGDKLERTEPITAQLYPDPLPAVEGFHIPKLDYLGKLTHAGELLHEQDEQMVHMERPYALYRAKMTREECGDNKVDVVVKFTVRYNEEAHRILAEKQLAPTLYSCIPVVGDMYMVIMDYVEGEPLFFAQERGDRERIYSDVETAIKLLHEQDLVFGDLRVQNIISKPSGGAVLIDFDWAGKHQVDRYPASWNNDTKLAPGVGRRMLMDKAQDTFMLGVLRAFLKDE